MNLSKSLKPNSLRRSSSEPWTIRRKKWINRRIFRHFSNANLFGDHAGTSRAGGTQSVLRCTMAGLWQSLFDKAIEFSEFEAQSRCVYTQFALQIARLCETSNEVVTVDLKRGRDNEEEKKKKKKTLRLVVELVRDPVSGHALHFAVNWYPDDKSEASRKVSSRTVNSMNLGKITTVVMRMCRGKDSLLQPGMRLCRYDAVKFHQPVEHSDPIGVINSLGKMI